MCQMWTETNDKVQNSLMNGHPTQLHPPFQFSCGLVWQLLPENVSILSAVWSQEMKSHKCVVMTLHLPCLPNRWRNSARKPSDRSVPREGTKIKARLNFTNFCKFERGHCLFNSDSALSGLINANNYPNEPLYTSFKMYRHQKHRRQDELTSSRKRKERRDVLW